MKFGDLVLIKVPFNNSSRFGIFLGYGTRPHYDDFLHFNGHSLPAVNVISDRGMEIVPLEHLHQVVE